MPEIPYSIIVGLDRSKWFAGIQKTGARQRPEAVRVFI
jgi:hypothetical protein